MKLYYHKTDGGAEYLTDKRRKNPDGSWEGVFKGAKYIVRIDGDIRKDAELTVSGGKAKPESRVHDASNIQSSVETALARRHADLHMTSRERKRDEAAFLSGASCALQAVFGNPDDKSVTDYISALWIIAPMCGLLLADLKKRNGDA